MKIDFNQTLPGMDGEPLMYRAQKPGETDHPLTLKEAAIMSIRATLPGDEMLDAIKKVELGSVGICLFKDLDLTVEQVALVKDRIGKAFVSSELVTACFNAIEAPTPEA